MSVSSKYNGLYRHDLVSLIQQKHTAHRSFLPERFEKHFNKYTSHIFLVLPSYLILTISFSSQRKSCYQDVKNCIKCCTARNPLNGYKYLCVGCVDEICLMQWYDPLNNFMLLKVNKILTLNTNTIRLISFDISENYIFNSDSFIRIRANY